MRHCVAASIRVRGDLRLCVTVSIELDAGHLEGFVLVMGILLSVA